MKRCSPTSANAKGVAGSKIVCVCACVCVHTWGGHRGTYLPRAVLAAAEESLGVVLRIEPHLKPSIRDTFAYVCVCARTDACTQTGRARMQNGGLLHARASRSPAHTVVGCSRDPQKSVLVAHDNGHSLHTPESSQVLGCVGAGSIMTPRKRSHDVAVAAG